MWSVGWCAGNLKESVAWGYVLQGVSFFLLFHGAVMFMSELVKP